MKSKAFYEQIQLYANIYKQIYDIVRIIDPQSKEVIKSIGYECDDFCYSFWSSNEKCDNCITETVQEDNKTTIKIQGNGNKMYLMIAAFINIEGFDLTFELIKEITNNLSFVTINQEREKESTIQNINDVILQDSLTKVYNRRYINQTLPQDIVRSMENKEALTVVMVDIDNFKNINDTFGHHIGDTVLQKFSNLIKSFIRRDVDWAARYGGDEFLICIHNVTEEEAIIIVERMRIAIEHMRIKFENSEIKVTGSFGLCTAIDGEFTAEELIKIADERLYEAKKLGKNKIISCILMK